MVRILAGIVDCVLGKGEVIVKVYFNSVCCLQVMRTAGWAVARECCGSVKWGLIEISRL